MVAIQSTPLHDLYVVYAGRNPENGKPVIHAYLNPLVKVIWFGGIVVVLGTGLALLPNRRAALVLRPVHRKFLGRRSLRRSRRAVSPVSAKVRLDMTDARRSRFCFWPHEHRSRIAPSRNRFRPVAP